MTTFNLQVSAHGSLNTTSFPAAHEWQYKFFCRMGEVLDWDKSVEIYNYLNSNNIAQANAMVVHNYFADAEINDYYLWDLNDSSYVSGILQAGSTNAVVDITGYTEGKPTTLSTLIAMAVDRLGINAVSYTHLTLPTIYSV